MIIGDILRATGLYGPVSAGLRYVSPEARANRMITRAMNLFARRYKRYWDGIVPDRSVTSRPEIFDAVRRDGFALVPNYLSPERLDALRREVFALPGLLDGSYSGPLPFTHKASDGLCGFGITRELPEAYAATVENQELHGIARALFGSTIRLSAAAILSKYNKDKIDSAEVPHWDDWRVRLKMFIYLTDVNAENAPTLFIRNSVDRVPWRLEKDFASVHFPVGSAGGSWWPVDQLGLERVLCTGKAGTMLVFDARGIHAGTPLLGSPRVMLMTMFTTHIEFSSRRVY